MNKTKKNAFDKPSFDLFAPLVFLTGLIQCCLRLKYKKGRKFNKFIAKC